MDRDFAPLFNFLTKPAQVFEELPAAPVAPIAPAKPAVTPAKAPAAAAASGLLRRLQAARTTVRLARTRFARRAAVRDAAAKPDRIRVWIDLDELAANVVRADGRSPSAADAAEWLLRLNFIFDGEAWGGDRDDLRLLGNVGVLKVRRGE